MEFVIFFAALGKMTMTKFYLHVRALDELFEDNIGHELPDLSAAHGRAISLANRIVMLSGFADSAPDWNRWTMQITDTNQQLLLTLIFPAHMARHHR